jgi:hypothetical protein
MSGRLAAFSSFFLHLLPRLIRPSDLCTIIINLEVWILYAVGWTPWVGDYTCRKTAKVDICDEQM